MANMPFPGFMLSLVVLSIILTWLFNSTRGSLLLCQVFRQSHNSWAIALGVTAEVVAGEVAPSLIGVVLDSLVAIGLVVVYGSARLSRHPVQQAAMPSPRARAVTSFLIRAYILARVDRSRGQGYTTRFIMVD